MFSPNISWQLTFNCPSAVSNCYENARPDGCAVCKSVGCVLNWMHFTHLHLHCKKKPCQLFSIRLDCSFEKINRYFSQCRPSSGCIRLSAQPVKAEKPHIIPDRQRDTNFSLTWRRNWHFSAVRGLSFSVHTVSSLTVTLSQLKGPPGLELIRRSCSDDRDRLSLPSLRSLSFSLFGVDLEPKP